MEAHVRRVRESFTEATRGRANRRQAAGQTWLSRPRGELCRAIMPGSVTGMTKPPGRYSVPFVEQKSASKREGSSVGPITKWTSRNSRTVFREMVTSSRFRQPGSTVRETWFVGGRAECLERRVAMLSSVGSSRSDGVRSRAQRVNAVGGCGASKRQLSRANVEVVRSTWAVTKRRYKMRGLRKA